MHFAPRSRYVLPALTTTLALVVSVSLGGHAWPLAVAAMFLLGRSYGKRAHAQSPSNQPTYGVGAALAGFTPDKRG